MMGSASFRSRHLENEMECSLDGIAGKGRCCCNCQYQMIAMKHPWNDGEAKGRITEIFGALCAVPDMVSDEGRRQAVFFQRVHGICEMHRFKTPNSGVERGAEGGSARTMG